MGDSLVRGAERALDVPLPVIWQGKSSAGLCEFNELLDGLSGPTPSIIIVHLGTNDLLAVDEFSMRQPIALSMDRCLMQFPNTLLIWSDILPRVFYCHGNFTLELDLKCPLNENAVRLIVGQDRKAAGGVWALCTTHSSDGLKPSSTVMMLSTCLLWAIVFLLTIFVKLFA